ncbi:hypothetical protein [Halothiobacillus sp. DCM-1]|uniref:hypothetical protein n=1 Tax=Halothiobacillus sp. DCM-1 TaxID=3112558 RepID=UPI003245DEBD
MNSMSTSPTPASVPTPADRWWVLLLLAGSMAATRYHHFSDVLHLADTSWAVFFLAGLWLRARWVFPALLGLALGIDLISVVQDGAAMNACFTPAYPGLLLAYGALWLAGRAAQRALDTGLVQILNRLGWATIGTLAAFALSNLTFWAFSGHFGALGLLDYADRVMPYLGRYIQSTLGYVLIGLAVAHLGTLRLRAPANPAPFRQG